VNNRRRKHNDIFIIGGGSGLKGFPFSQLKDKTTIAVNMAALDVPNPTYCLTADSRIFRKVQQGVFRNINTTWVVVISTAIKFRDGRLQRVNSNFAYNPLCAHVLINYTKADGIGFSFNDFRTGFNSGFCAFQLAVLLGYQKIYLLGFDLNLNPKEYHYHKRYKGRKISNKNLNRYYENFKLAFGILKKETDIEIFSCSKNSRLNQHIPYIPFEEI